MQKKCNMSIWNFFKRKRKEDNLYRKIKTIRGHTNIEKAISNGSKLIYREVELFSAVKGKYCILKNKKSGKESKIYDFRDNRIYSKEYEIVKNWTNQYHIYDFPDEAAYVIPNEIQEGEIVFIDDLIENFLGYQHNQGLNDRLNSCAAVWKNNDLQILYKPKNDLIRVVG